MFVITGKLLYRALLNIRYSSLNKSTCVYLANRNPNIISCEAEIPAPVLPCTWHHFSLNVCAEVFCLSGTCNTLYHCPVSSQLKIPVMPGYETHPKREYSTFEASD